jgi:hypothetical protein
MPWSDDYYPGSSDYPRSGDDPEETDFDPWVEAGRERGGEGD